MAAEQQIYMGLGIVNKCGNNEEDKVLEGVYSVLEEQEEAISTMLIEDILDQEFKSQSLKTIMKISKMVSFQ